MRRLSGKHPGVRGVGRARHDEPGAGRETREASSPGNPPIKGVGRHYTRFWQVTHSA